MAGSRSGLDQGRVGFFGTPVPSLILPGGFPLSRGTGREKKELVSKPLSGLDSLPFSFLLPPCPLPRVSRAVPSPLSLPHPLTLRQDLAPRKRLAVPLGGYTLSYPPTTHAENAGQVHLNGNGGAGWVLLRSLLFVPAYFFFSVCVCAFPRRGLPRALLLCCDSSV